MRASGKFFFDNQEKKKKKKKREEKKEKKKKGATIARWQCNALQEFLTPKKKEKTMIISVSEIEKEAEEEFCEDWGDLWRIKSEEGS